MLFRLFCPIKVSRNGKRKLFEKLAKKCSALRSGWNKRIDIFVRQINEHVLFTCDCMIVQDQNLYGDYR